MGNLKEYILNTSMGTKSDRAQNRCSHASAGLLRAMMALLLVPFLLIQGCASLSPNFEKPDVQVTAVEPLPNNHSGDLRFRIHLRVFNPNDSALALSGLYYTLKLAGHKVITGTSNNLPVIPAYGQDAIVVDASANLMGSIMAMTELVRLQGDTVPYELEAKLGLQQSILPAIRVSKSGELRLGQYQN
ncbi:LEA type 2 family protein [Microbulbifer sp. HZ11]|uniref:LEA type 2 family protein n=1 Tax=Microbulbifer sp. HZ11 TaxID=1453501 RepID=UPI0009E02F74|nr:LEA type 2 family protein [Microbulbifer sp. HZ11]